MDIMCLTIVSCVAIMAIVVISFTENNWRNSDE